ncbi:MAG TPA: UDP-N-acetylmuramoyl-L-alanine--D-glutamate ligase [Acidimicrobiales bacterium]|nr:UDP-N-acetylmuramoyl-L-alanine--D-glutamate ligase [Acidimicrobiales bacterium]
MPDHALVVGLGVTGEAVTRQLVARGARVSVADDRMTPALAERVTGLGARPADPASPLAGVDLVLPSPGVPFAHPVATEARERGLPVWSELELAAAWDDRPTVAITGTNGKTTVTTLVTAMLAEAGRPVVAAGNNELPLVDALDRADVELFVVEASSFRLQYVERYRPVVAAWLNLSPDHLDWHPSVEHYAAAKAGIWAAQRDDDLAVVNAEDPEVMRWAAGAPGRVETFGLATGDARVAGGELRAADGSVLARVGDLPRRLPHDLANALAASSVALAAGGTVAACRSVLERFEGLPHRVRLVGEAGGVRWYDDSKATTPASVVTAVGGFDSVVLVAGGRNKGLDFSPLGRLAPRLRGVVAIGESAPLVESVFRAAAPAVPVVVAGSMDEAVSRAGAMARPGDAVLLSPGGASQDWYRNYEERGDDFARAVAARLAVAG